MFRILIRILVFYLYSLYEGSKLSVTYYMITEKCTLTCARYFQFLEFKACSMKPLTLISLFIVYYSLSLGSAICSLGTSSPPLLEERFKSGLRILVRVRFHDNSGQHSRLYGLRKLGQAEQRLCGVK